MTTSQQRRATGARAPKPRRSKGAGTIRQLPSGRYQAIFKHDGLRTVRTVDTRQAAQKWLDNQRKAVVDGTWTVPVEEVSDGQAPKFSDYSKTWMAERNLKPKTVEGYQRVLDRYLLPRFGNVRIDTITPAMVKDWHKGLLLDKPTMRSHTYGLLRTILNTAWQDDLIPSNPCRVRGAGNVKRVSQTEIPTAVEVHALADEMGVTHNNDGSERVLADGKYKVLTLIAAWCGLRFGETTELRRFDVVVVDDVPVAIKVRRGVVRVDGEFIVQTPKSGAGTRDVTIPPHIRADVAEYLRQIDDDPAALLFPGSRNGDHMAPSALYKPFYRAREAVGLPSLRWHDLRHFSATVAAQTGASLAELQSRLGHSTVQAAMRYQHAASNRDAEIAEAMSNVVPLKRKGA